MKKVATLTIASSLALHAMTADYSTNSLLTLGSCGNHEVVKDGHCVCKKGYVKHDGECKRCPDYSFYDCTHNTCKCEPTY